MYLQEQPNALDGEQRVFAVLQDRQLEEQKAFKDHHIDSHFYYNRDGTTAGAAIIGSMILMVILFVL